MEGIFFHAFVLFLASESGPKQKKLKGSGARVVQGFGDSPSPSPFLDHFVGLVLRPHSQPNCAYWADMLKIGFFRGSTLLFIDQWYSRKYRLQLEA
jgi:hypothetical protein